METYLLRAAELHGRHPIVAYRLRKHYLDLATSDFTGFDKELVGELMQELEAAKAMMPHQATPEAANLEMHSLANDLRERASQNDRPDERPSIPLSRWWLDTAPQVCKAYHAAAVIVDACQQFGELTDDDTALLATCHTRAMTLARDLKNALGQQVAVIPLQWRMRFTTAPHPLLILVRVLLPLSRRLC